MKMFACGVVAASLAVSAFADVAFSTFGPGDSYIPTGGYIVGGNQDLILGAQFTAQVSGTLLSVEFATTTRAAGSISILLREDESNEAGPIIMDHTVAAPPVGDPAKIVKLSNSLTFITLTAGRKYWIEARGIGTGLDSLWHFSNQSGLGRTSSEGAAFNKFYQDDQIMPAFRVNVVPEPASMVALGLGALALIRNRRKNR